MTVYLRPYYIVGVWNGYRRDDDEMYRKFAKFYEHFRSIRKRTRQ